MTQESDLRRQVQFLRVRLAHAEATAADNYKTASVAAVAVAGALWALLSSVLEGGLDSEAHWLGAGPLALAALCWWTASRHHHAKEEALAEAMAEARAAGYSVEIMRGGIHFAERSPASNRR